MTTVLQALNSALFNAMEESDLVYLLGEDVLDPYGGAFKVVRGLSTAFPERVITTPVSEAGIVGVGVGMALRGLRPVVEIMFGDFIALAADQLINHAAKIRWISHDRVSVPLVIRTPMGGGRGYGPTHSQSLEKHILGIPGLKIIAVSSLDDPGKLLQQAIQDDDPIVFIEHKLLYRASVLPLGDVQEFTVRRKDGRYPSYRLILIGAPRPELTLIAYGHMAELARQAILRAAYEHEIFCELVVPTRLSPSDLELLVECLSNTGRLLTIEEGSHTFGWGAEVLAAVVEKLGSGLSARRLGASDMPIPAARSLEAAVLPDVDAILRTIVEMMGSEIT
jgi:pyruvate/2-oxoglutarate/acetoin dehydrogenase E1 component